jgi:hypothetical protein
MRFSVLKRKGGIRYFAETLPCWTLGNCKDPSLARPTANASMIFGKWQLLCRLLTVLSSDKILLDRLQ